MRKKILFFNGFYPDVRGGAELQAKIIAEQCLKQDYDVVFISIEDKEQSISTVENCKVYVIPNPNNRLNNWTLYYFFMQRMRKIIATEKPNIIYQRILNSFSPYLAKYAQSNKIPFVLHIANTHCFEFTSSVRDKIRKHLFNRLKNYPVQYVAQTKEQEQLLLENGLQSSLLMPNFYKTESKLKEELDKPLKILWVANIRPVKQVALFLDLAKQLKDFPFEFVVAGRIEKESKRSFYRNTFVEMDNLNYLGEKTMEEIDLLMEEAFLLVNTSRSEGFSNTFVQAWAKGTPVVSLNSDPNSYIIENKVGIFADGDFEVLKNAFIDYTENHALYETHCVNANRLYKEELSFEKNSSKLIQFFENIQKP